MNPYLAPQAYGAAPPAYDANAEYNMAVGQMLEGMRKTRPWITMFSIMSFIGGGFMVLAALMMMFTGAMAGSAMSGPAAAMGPGLGFFYLVMSGFYFVVGKLLWNYRSSIESFLASGGNAGMLASAVDKQASFWKFVGILTLVMMGLYFVLIIAMVSFMATTIR